MSQLAGRYELASTENYSEFLKALGVALPQRTLEETSKPTIEVTGTDRTWSIKIRTALLNTELNFTLGQEFQEKLLDGRTCRTTITQDAPSPTAAARDSLIQVQQLESQEARIVWSFFPTELHVSYETRGVNATRVFARIRL
ncbi:lipocalin/fatty-acid binding family protein [Streptomyces sp. NPDC058369]|uniref:lipocalin/fatty-acid binding family protein n=1 Tax=Streptomyces sp. NPDC058369 TaxID=3346462 RepID=UPI00365C489C